VTTYEHWLIAGAVFVAIGLLIFQWIYNNWDE
jgi:hypothetical protein